MGSPGDLGDLAVVVLSCNRLGELKDNIPRLLDSARTAAFELVVVDNNSSDGSKEFLESQEWGAGTHLLLNDENLGVAGGRNLGWKSTSRSLILNLDDDTRPDTEAIAELVRYMRDNQNVGIASPRVLHPETGDDQTPYGDTDCEVSNFHGACHIVRREVFRRVGYLDEQCRYGGEELEYSLRVRARGWTIEHVPSVTVYHNSLRHTGAEASSRRLQWVSNYVRILYTYFPFAQATKMAFRYSAPHLVRGCKSRGPAFAIRLLWELLPAARSGRARFTPLPDRVLGFCSSPTLLPDFGNVPMSSKVHKRLVQGRRRSVSPRAR